MVKVALNVKITIIIIYNFINVKLVPMEVSLTSRPIHAKWSLQMHAKVIKFTFKQQKNVNVQLINHISMEPIVSVVIFLIFGIKIQINVNNA